MKIQKLVGWAVILFQVLAPGLPITMRTAGSTQSVQAPVLKWQKGGCYSSWCETGWYSSPAVADLDGDGTMEVIGGTYSVFILNGEDGTVQRAMDPAGSRVWPGVVVADIDEDGDLDIVTAHGDGYVNLFDHDGNLTWSRKPASNELRSLAVADLEGDGTMEIVVGQALLNKVNTWVYEPNGTIRPGWPQLADNEGSAAGIYNDNIGLGDLDGDGVVEIVVPSDTITICAYEPDGTHLQTNTMYHDQPGHDMDHWGEVPAYVDLAYEVQGWGPCSNQFTPRANFADGPANVVDVNGDGVNEVVAIGNVHDCHTNPYTDVYNTPYILNADRSRFDADGFDWTTPPINTGAPLSENYNVIESDMPNPVTVDLDGDGKLEILYASYDGRLHAFWLDKTEHYDWPYSVYHASEGFYRFASEPVVADLDNDGHPEVLFGSWVQKGTGRTGKLHILDYQGNPLQEVNLPASFGGNWNGALAAPTLANIDADTDLEVVLNTSSSGFVAYDLPGTSNARILWGTGRGSYQRTGSILYGSLETSRLSASPLLPGPGDTVTYSIYLENPGPILTSVHVTDTLSADVTYAGDLSASSGTYGEAGGVITWSGSVGPATPVTISFSAVVEAQVTMPLPILNTAWIEDSWGHEWVRQATVIANGQGNYLPLASK
jgi:uncharacterized repeat protein (TIGR01451 family)